MRYILYLNIDGLYARHQTPDPKVPWVLFKEKTVLDASESARRHGVVPGMGLAEARAILHGEGSFKEWSAEQFVATQEIWLDLCAKCTNAIEPESQHSGWLDLSGHPEPFIVCRQLKEMLCRQFGNQIQMGLGKWKWLSKLSARVCHPNTPFDLWQQTMECCLFNTDDFLSPISVIHLDPLESEYRDRLLFLGYSTIGQTKSLPYNLLKSQFGRSAHKIQQLISGTYFDQVIPIYPKLSLGFSFYFPNAAETVDQLLTGIHSVSKRLHFELQKKDLHGTDVMIELEYANDCKESLQRRFVKPIYSQKSIYFALNLLVKQVNQPVNSFFVRISGLQPNSASQQNMNGHFVKSQSIEKSSDAINSLKTVFGKHAVRQASELSDNRRSKLLRFWKDVTGWV